MVSDSNTLFLLAIILVESTAVWEKSLGVCQLTELSVEGAVRFDALLSGWGGSPGTAR